MEQKLTDQANYVGSPIPKYIFEVQIYFYKLQNPCLNCHIDKKKYKIQNCLLSFLKCVLSVATSEHFVHNPCQETLMIFHDLPETEILCYINVQVDPKVAFCASTACTTLNQNRPPSATSSGPQLTDQRSLLHYKSSHMYQVCFFTGNL